MSYRRDIDMFSRANDICPLRHIMLQKECSCERTYLFKF